MYFEGDPLFPLDDIFLEIPDEQKPRAMCRFDEDLTEPGWALGYRFDIVLRGPLGTPWEADEDREGGRS